MIGDPGIFKSKVVINLPSFTFTAASPTWKLTGPGHLCPNDQLILTESWQLLDSPMLQGPASPTWKLPAD